MLPQIQRAAEARARSLAHIDWFLLIFALAISLLALALGIFFVASIPEYGFLRRTPVVVGMYGAIATLLVFVLFVGSVIKGAQTRFDLGFFFVQPAEPAKLVLVATLAKYFTRRHIEKSHIRHILVSGSYAFLLFGL